MSTHRFTQPLISCKTCAVSLGIKLPEREDDHLHLYSAEVKSAYCLNKQVDGFTLVSLHFNEDWKVLLEEISDNRCWGRVR
jgi:hypothetical protein